MDSTALRLFPCLIYEPRSSMNGGLAIRCDALWLAVLIAAGPHAKYFTFGERRRWWVRFFPPCTNLFLANSHQNSHSPKIKMAADLAASHLVDFI
jgi:hypothetical protein